MAYITHCSDHKKFSFYSKSSMTNTQSRRRLHGLELGKYNSGETLWDTPAETHSDVHKMSVIWVKHVPALRTFSEISVAGPADHDGVGRVAFSILKAAWVLGRRHPMNDGVDRCRVRTLSPKKHPLLVKLRSFSWISSLVIKVCWAIGIRNIS